MGRKSTLLFLTLLLSFNLSGQNGSVQIGAKPAGLGYSYAAISDSWAIFYNPAGLSKIDETEVLFSFENKFNIEGLNTLGSAFITTWDIGSLGLSLFRFGDDIYNEQLISFSYANTFGITSLGIRINYFQYFSEITENRHALSIDFGGITTLNDQLNFGAYIKNINQAKISGESDQNIPVILNAGFSYQPTNQLKINAEIEKDIDFDPGARIGLEYTFLKRLKVRSGVLTYPYTNYFGLGFNTTKLNIDYSITLNGTLGLSHQASISYQLRKK